MYANMTMHTATGELVISMERFVHLLTSVKCGENTVLTFKDKASFEYAIKAWNWVNEDETHSFILIADYAGCGPDDVRVPFYIQNADYDEEKFIAYLYGKEIPWKQAAHTFDLDYGTATLVQTPSRLSRRIGPDVTYNKDVSIDIAHNLNGNIYTYGSKASGFLVKLDCTDCGLAGKLTLGGRIKVDATSVSELSVSLTPQDVSASITLKLHAEGKSSRSINYEPTLAEIGIPGASFKIPGGVAEVGIFVEANFGFELGSWEGDATMTYGVTAAISNAARFKIDLANNNAVDFAGWKPAFTQKPFDINAKASIEASVYNAIGLVAKVEVLSEGYEVALTLKSPELATKLTTLTNSKGVCGTKKKVGVSVDAELKASVEVSAGQTGKGGIKDINLNPRRVGRRSSAELARRVSENVVIERGVVRRNVPGLSFSKTLWVCSSFDSIRALANDGCRRARYLGSRTNVWPLLERSHFSCIRVFLYLFI
jgi:hypothetical protein